MHTDAKEDKLQECAQIIDDIAAVKTGPKCCSGRFRSPPILLLWIVAPIRVVAHLATCYNCIMSHK